MMPSVTSPAVTAVVSLSAAPAVMLNPSPDGNQIPPELNDTSEREPAASGIRHSIRAASEAGTGTELLLQKRTYLVAADVFTMLQAFRTVGTGLTLVALVVAVATKLKVDITRDAVR
jgi:hypothetical protein